MNLPDINRRFCKLLSTCMVVTAICAAPPAHAAKWSVCNGSAEDIAVAIVYSVGDARNYISKGWWNVGAHGACRVVYQGNLPIRGAYLRGEGTKGDVWEGDSLFCTSPSRFEIPNANVDRASCRHRGYDQKAFRLHVIKGNDFTTTLTNTH